MADNASANNGGEAIDERRQRLNRVRRRLDFGQEPASMLSDEDTGVVLKDAETSSNFALTQVKEASEKWNFDFANEVPLEGVWDWQKVEPRSHQEYKEFTIVRENKNGNENRSV